MGYLALERHESAGSAKGWPGGGGAMNTNELTLERALPIWWAFVWRATLSVGVAGVFVGFMVSLIVGAAGAPELGRPVGAVLGWLASIPCSVWAFREALISPYRDFEIALVGKASMASTPPPTEVMPAEALSAVSVGQQPDKGGLWLVSALAAVGVLILVLWVAAAQSPSSSSIAPTEQAAASVTPPSAPAAAVAPADSSMAPANTMPPDVAVAPAGNSITAPASMAPEVANHIVDAPAPEPTQHQIGLVAPNLSRLNDDERQSIEMACNSDKVLNGPAAYDKCLIHQLSRMTPDIRFPNLSVLSEDEKQSIQMACNSDKVLNGPSDYDRCLSRKLAELGR